MAWIALIGAGLFEMLGVVMMNEMYRRKSWIPVALLVIFFSMSFWLLSVAMAVIPMGTAYAIWTGIGASGGAILGMVLYGESKDWKRIVCITLIIGSVIGLKLISQENALLNVISIERFFALSILIDVDEDVYTQAFHVLPNTTLYLTTQAATKVYKGTQPTRVETLIKWC